MRFAIDLAKLIVWFPLELLVIATLLRGQYRRFPFIFAYVVVEFLAVAAEIPAYWVVYRGVNVAETPLVWLYNVNEVILQVLIYAVVISLIYKASETLQSRKMVRTSVIYGAILFAAGSFLFHYSPSAAIGTWMTPWTRDLSFCSVVLDLALWVLLISSRDKDHRLLLLSGGLGVRFTGEAIGESIRQLALKRHSHGLSYSGSLLITIVDLLCLFVWWQALRVREAVPVPAKRPAESAGM